jgi:hypothetical protein
MKHGILVCTLAAGMAWAQSPEILHNTRAQMNTVQKKAGAASTEALGTNPSAPPAGKASQAAAKPAATPVKPSAAAAKSATPAKVSVVAAKHSTTPAKVSVVAAKSNAAPAKAGAVAAKVAVKHFAARKEAKPAAAQKKAEAAPKSHPLASSAAASAGEAEVAKANDNDSEKDKQSNKWNMSGKRDPFISPVVNHTGGSGCSTGKKCLEIGAVNLRGVVHSDAGFIAVVTNRLNKAYFLRENDPVFDGYVVKITGDSIVFQETLQDRLGKRFTREVVKKIATPVV